MSYHPRIESKILASFVTIRSRNSELWFVNNERLEDAVLGYAAKYAYVHKVKLYALAIEGSHIQAPGLFPECNRANFMRDFNSCVARAVRFHTPEYPGGRLWGRRYSSEFLPGTEDIEEYFFYTVLQPIKDGLVERLSDYPGYNCFNDAVKGITRKYKVIRWAEFNTARYHNPEAKITDYTDIVTLQYERLPGYESLTQDEYAKLMYEKLEQRRLKIIEERCAKGLGFMGKAALLKVKRGTRALSPKTSHSKSHRPRILCVCNARRAQYKAWYFKIYFEYKAASLLYRKGDFEVIFPLGTYRPYCNYHPPNEEKAAA